MDRFGDTLVGYFSIFASGILFALYLLDLIKWFDYNVVVVIDQQEREDSKMTQATSEQRVKYDTLGDASLTELYAAYNTASNIDELKKVCKQMIEKSTAKKATKDKFNRLISEATQKDKVVGLTQNFILAGMGLGV